MSYRKAWTVVAALLVCHSSAGAVELTKPLSANPDRVLELKLLYTLKGDGHEGIFFQYPQNPLFLDEGRYLLICDIKQLLLFDRQGRFVKNLQTTGEGPGEWGRTRAVFTDDSCVTVIGSMPGIYGMFDWTRFVPCVMYSVPGRMAAAGLITLWMSPVPKLDLWLAAMC